ncbi:Dal81p [Sugiyamaella lignohabitans]|uniref:Dal81p n=1 Tax=Sugiyamaella lignohabitans TaxID=796027 RepID=A0A161HHP7_9ASCO|nr:Dal81p [Sugiyamaella lignohabitans]ANB11727.1 Dal81p [Sugiyamaella lignohabitans]
MQEYLDTYEDIKVDIDGQLQQQQSLGDSSQMSSNFNDTSAVSPQRMKQEYLSNTNVFPYILEGSMISPDGSITVGMGNSPPGVRNNSANGSGNRGYILDNPPSDGSSGTIQQSPPELANQTQALGPSTGSGMPTAPAKNPKFMKMRPCDECRRRKSGCIMADGSNTCLTCQVNGIACTFIEGPRSRKRNTSSTAKDANFGSASNNNSANASGDSSNANKRAKINTTVTEIAAEPAAEQSRYINPVQDYASIRGHSLLKKTLGLQYPKSAVYVGDTSVYDNVLLDSGNFDKKDEAELPGNISLRRAGPGAVFILSTDDGPQESVEDVDEIEKLTTPYGKQLIDLYFRTVHPYFPVLDKDVFLEKYSRTHREFVPCLLAAVYILALKWWYYDVNLSSLPKPDITAKLYQLAVESFHKVCGHPKIPVVQAGILLVQCKPSDDRHWLICSQVVPCAERIGLGLDCQNWKVPKWERGLRKRLAWAVYLLDKWLSLIEAQPSHISDNYWLVAKLTPDDFASKSSRQDGDDSTSGASSAAETPIPEDSITSPVLSTDQPGQVFIEMITLSQIVNEIIDTLFTYKSKALIRDTEEILEVAKPIQIKLRRWYLGLPESLQINSAKPRQLSAHGGLHLAYFGAEITLHRRIIRSLTKDSPQELTEVCREAGKARLLAAMEFVRGLRPEHMQSFWHFSASANFALIGSFAALLFVTATTKDEQAFYRSEITEYMWRLRVLNGFGEMAAALRQLGITMSRIPGLKSPDIQAAY